MSTVALVLSPSCEATMTNFDLTLESQCASCTNAIYILWNQLCFVTVSKYLNMQTTLQNTKHAFFSEL